MTISAIPARTLPTISDARQLIDHLQKWKGTLRGALRSPVAPPPPFNFSATGIRGAIQLAWAPVRNPVIKGALGQNNVGPDGYEILKSASGDFVSDLIVIPVRSADQTSYTDTVGGNVTTISYRIHSTSGTLSKPHSVIGPDSGVVTVASLDASDNVTVPTTVRDNYTTDGVRATARTGGNYPHGSVQE